MLLDISKLPLTDTVNVLLNCNMRLAQVSLEESHEIQCLRPGALISRPCYHVFKASDLWNLSLQESFCYYKLIRICSLDWDISLFKPIWDSATIDSVGASLVLMFPDFDGKLFGSQETFGAEVCFVVQPLKEWIQKVYVWSHSVQMVQSHNLLVALWCF